MSYEPRVRIVMTGHGRGDIFVDGVKQQNVRRVEFESDAENGRPNLVRITLNAATVEIDSAVSRLFPGGADTDPDWGRLPPPPAPRCTKTPLADMEAVGVAWIIAGALLASLVIWAITQ